LQGALIHERPDVEPVAGIEGAHGGDAAFPQGEHPGVEFAHLGPIDLGGIQHIIEKPECLIFGDGLGDGVVRGVFFRSVFSKPRVQGFKVEECFRGDTNAPHQSCYS